MAHQSERIEAVIFDCDGTLVDSETISLRVMSELVGEFGHEISHADAVRRFSGQDLKLVIRELESDMGRELPDDFMERFRERQIPCLQQELQPIAGARESFLRRIQRATGEDSSLFGNNRIETLLSR
jgi:beta-phosphoglucomutase-like phosphatase (HAD superfamily)